jgi:hypothetical protein
MENENRRTEIWIETHEVKTVRFRGKQVSVHCERCSAMVTALSVDHAAVLLRIGPDEVFRRLAEEEFHLVETIRGLPGVCGNSLRP